MVSIWSTILSWNGLNKSWGQWKRNFSIKPTQLTLTSSKSTIETLQQCQWCSSVVFIVSFAPFSSVYKLLTLARKSSVIFFSFYLTIEIIHKFHLGFKLITTTKTYFQSTFLKIVIQKRCLMLLNNKTDICFRNLH